MNSKTKNMLSRANIERLAGNAFGSGTNVRFAQELTDGYYNSAFLIGLENMREVILKVAPPPQVEVLRYEKDLMKAEVEVLKLLKAKGEVPVPEVIFYDDTKKDCESEYFFMGKLEGTPYNKIRKSLPEEARIAIDTELGGYNRCINDIKGEKFGYFAQKDRQCVTWPEAFLGMVDDVLQDGLRYDIRLPRTYEQIYSLFDRSRKVLEPVTEPQLVHWDLWEGNVFIGEAGKITGLIDCERAFWGDPLMEYHFSNPVAYEAFCRGYGPDILDKPGVRHRRTLYNIYLHLVMVIECTYRQYENSTQEERCLRKLEEEFGLLEELQRA